MQRTSTMQASTSSFESSSQNDFGGERGWAIAKGAKNRRGGNTSIDKGQGHRIHRESVSPYGSFKKKGLMNKEF